MDIITDILPLIAMLGILGGVAGFLAGLLGVGGGIILVPGLYFIFTMLQPDMGFDTAHLMHVAVGTSLAVIVPTGISSALAHYRRDNVDFSLVINIGSGIVFGAIFALWIASSLDGQSMKLIFAIVILMLAVIMIANPARFRISENMPSQPLSSIAGFFIGWVSALVGIGGATLSVPYMSLHNVPMHRAIGSASVMGVIIAVPAAIGFILIGYEQVNLPPFSVGYVNVMAWGLIMAVSVVFAPIGARVAHRCKPWNLRIIFAVFMVMVALNMWRDILMVG